MLARPFDLFRNVLMKFGLIATGRIADTQLAPALNAAEGAQLWSVYSRDAARAGEFAAKHGAASPTPGYGDLDAMLADPELDAVLIASPDKLHAPQTLAANYVETIGDLL